MVLEKVVWTALPNHLDPEKRLRVSVHIAPRLVNDDGSSTPRKLGEARAFVDWPARLSTLGFLVEFDNGVVGRGIPDFGLVRALWHRLFPRNTPLQPFAFQDHATRDMHVFPVREVHRFLQDTYGAVAAAGIDHPSIDDAAGPLSRFAPLEYLTWRATDGNTFRQELVKARRPPGWPPATGHVVRAGSAAPSGSPQAVENAFHDAYRFYYRPGSQRPDLPEEYVEPSPAVPVLDFHQRVSALADHPQVLRMLGLVVDLVVDIEEPHAHLAATGMVRVAVEGELPETPPMCPWTRYELDDDWFGARPERGEIERGLLRLSRDAWEVFQVDVDGAALQVVGFADTLRRMRDPGQRNHGTPGVAAVPALRSAGLSLARTQRGDMLLEYLVSRRAKNAQIEAGQTPVFDAEDLVRGYRIDVRDADAADGPRWFSLHRRVARHEAPANNGDEDVLAFEVTDEGYIKATSASSERADHPTPSDDLYLHETVFGWEGWSLSAPRPGKRIVEPGEGERGGDVARYDPRAGSPALVTQVGPEPRTLPRLRMGHRYQLRARTVDLAGNSRPFSPRDLEPRDPALVSAEHMYVRFEPVPSPTVLRRHRDTEGESLEHLVIRSDLGMSAADYAESPDVRAALAQAGSAQPYAADAQRHLAAPKGAEQMAEQHGRLDAAFGGSPANMTAALRVALREEGTFLDERLIDTTTGQKTIAQSTIQLVPPDTAPPARRGDGLPSGAYAVYPDESVVLPYLPDPLAIGVSLTGYDYSGSVVFEQVAPFSGAWPDLQPLRIRLSEGPLGVAFSEGVIEVRLPQSEVVYARIASVFPEDRLEDFAVWRWVPQPAMTDDLKKAAIQGRHWMLTPFRWVTFTHAVQRPLAVPDMTRVQATRSLGSTYAQFRGPIANHAKSTGRLDVMAEWTEDVDLLTDDEPRMRALGTAAPHQAHAFGFDLEPIEDLTEVAKPGRVPRHEFGDTKYRRIVYHSVATTRFREFLPRPIADDETQIQQVEPSPKASRATTGALVHDVLNAARPAAPDVAYVTPTFLWERQDGATRRHVRHGGGVRVWLRRPWFSSGDGEQLAVVLEPAVRLPRGWEHLDALELPAHQLATPLFSRTSLQANVLGTALSARSSRAPEVHMLAASDFTEKIGVGHLGALVTPPSADEIRTMLVPYVTSWGSDPVWQSGLPTRPPTVDDFPRRFSSASGLTLEELPDAARVVVAVHDVLYDTARKLWYCDIEIDIGDSYFPFVRLALARYQPHSVTGAHLSRVMMADFVQLAPTRTAEVTVSGGQVSVSVQGFSGRNQVADFDVSRVTFAGSNSTEVVRERLDISAATAAEALLGTASGLAPNTTMRVATQRRVPGVPGDLGWETVGPEVVLPPSASGFRVVWKGVLNLPADVATGSHRFLITESETYLRTDLIPGDPNLSTSPLDFVRERVVYADAFETQVVDFLVLLDSEATAADVASVTRTVEEWEGTVLALPAPFMLLARCDTRVQTALTAADFVVGLFPAAFAPVVGTLLAGGVGAVDLVDLLSGLMPSAPTPEPLTGAEDVPTAPGPPLALLQALK